eukprot:NODE_249_length_11770_cov_0.803530.p4 type:complete len:332 gc:universal NODE_249_length_11770_cov_0.803530:2434-1439(-)
MTNNELLQKILSHVYPIIKREDVFDKTLLEIRSEIERKMGLKLDHIKDFLTDHIILSVHQHYQSTAFEFPHLETPSAKTKETNLYKPSSQLFPILGKEVVQEHEVEGLVWDYAFHNNLLCGGRILADENLQRLCSVRIFEPSKFNFRLHLDPIITKNSLENVEEIEIPEKYRRMKLLKCSDDLAGIIKTRYSTYKHAVSKFISVIKKKDILKSRGRIFCDEELKKILNVEVISTAELSNYVKSQLEKVSKNSINSEQQLSGAKFLYEVDLEKLATNQDTILEEISNATDLKLKINEGKRHTRYVNMKYFEPSPEFAKICQVRYFPRYIIII